MASHSAATGLQQKAAFFEAESLLPQEPEGRIELAKTLMTCEPGCKAEVLYAFSKQIFAAADQTPWHTLLYPSPRP